MMFMITIINIHSMNTLNNETKHGANDTQLNNWSLYNINIKSAKKKIELDTKHV